MARTIGRKFKNLIVHNTKVAHGMGFRGLKLRDVVEHAIPVEAYDTWEMAHQEIERLIDDEIHKVEVA